MARVAPLTHGPAPLVSGRQAGAGYAITLEPARCEDLAPLLMRAWVLTPREREVARLVRSRGHPPTRPGGRAGRPGPARRSALTLPGLALMLA